MKTFVIAEGSTSGNNRSRCIARGWVTRDTILAHMQQTKLKVRMSSTGKVFSDSLQVLPCALEKLSCLTISLDPYAYIWDYHDNCVLSILQTEDVNMVKQRTKENIISRPVSTTNFVFENENYPQKQCRKPTDSYPTYYDSFFVAIINGNFDLRSGRNLVKERKGATQILQYIAPMRKTVLRNSMLTIRNTRPTKQAMKTCIWIWITKCTWEQNWTTSSSRAHNYFKLLR